MVFEQFRREFQAIRQAAAGYADMERVEGVKTFFNITANIQPVEAEVLVTLPEGYRTRDSYTLYTSDELKTAEVGLWEPDVVVIDSKEFIVSKVSRWDNISPILQIVDHYEVIVVEGDRDANP